MRWRGWGGEWGAVDFGVEGGGWKLEGGVTFECLFR